MMSVKYDLICIGMALVDSLIRGFNPVPVSASGYLASSGTLSAGGEAVNQSSAAAKLGLRTGILCALMSGTAAVHKKTHPAASLTICSLIFSPPLQSMVSLMSFSADRARPVMIFCSPALLSGNVPHYSPAVSVCMIPVPFFCDIHDPVSSGSAALARMVD